MFGVLSTPPLSSLLPLGPSTTSQLISDTRIINKTFAHKGNWDSSLPALPLSYKSIKYNFKIKYKEQKGPDLGATCSPQENESTHSSRTCLGDRGAPSQPHRAWRCRREEKGRARPGPRPWGLRMGGASTAHKGVQGFAANYQDLQCPGLGPTRALKRQRLNELRGERRPLEQERSKGKKC